MLFVDITIAVLLFATIIYLWRINKKIGELRNNKTEFAKMIKYFDDAIMRAELSIDELKTLSNRLFEEIKQKTDKAKFLADDLAFMTDRASELADKLDAKIVTARNAEKSMLAQRGLHQAATPSSISPQKPQMINPLAAERAQQVKPATNFKTEDNDARKKSIQSLLERISAANSNPEEEPLLFKEELYEDS